MERVAKIGQSSCPKCGGIVPHNLIKNVSGANAGTTFIKKVCPDCGFDLNAPISPSKPLPKAIPIPSAKPKTIIKPKTKPISTSTPKIVIPPAAKPKKIKVKKVRRAKSKRGKGDKCCKQKESYRKMSKVVITISEIDTWIKQAILHCQTIYTDVNEHTVLDEVLEQFERKDPICRDIVSKKQLLNYIRECIFNYPTFSTQKH